MIFVDRLVSWYGKKVVYGGAALIVILLVVGAFFLFGGSPTPEATESVTKTVRTSPASNLMGGTTGIRTVGTVRAISEARLQTESGGRVTGVNVKIGDSVGAGAVLASLENASERASLIQAEGAYEAAQVSGNQAGIGLAEAEVGARNAYRTSFTVADDAIRNLTDELFSNPDTQSPGVRVDAQGMAVILSEERVALGKILSEWNADVASGSSDDPRDLLDDAERDLNRISDFVATLSRLVSEEDANDVFTDEVLSGYKARFLGVRSRIDGALQSVSGSRTALLSAQQSATNGGVSTETSARIKQALGSLRSAQAAYEKTLVRSPISGTVNAMYLRANEYVAPNAPAAVIANNGALEITTSVSESERDLIAIGDSVRVEDEWDGTITAIAPAVDPISGKIEVRLAVDETSTSSVKLENGTTVSLALGTQMKTVTDGPLTVPLRALKITAEGPVAFKVEDDGTLRAIPVVLGPIVGDTVTIESGLAAEQVIVEDARGLKDGEKVTVESK